MKLLRWLIDKIFLVKTITSQEGVLHFLRYRLFACPWFRIYIHKITQPDEDLHFHDHPWSFFSFILKGCYWESWSIGPDYDIEFNRMQPRFSLIHHEKSDIHSIQMLGQGPVWTLVLAYGKYEDWGYRFGKRGIDHGADTWVNHQRYRKMKHENYFDGWGKLIKPLDFQN